MQTAENGRRMSGHPAAFSSNDTELEALVAKALVAASRPPSPDDQPLDDLALLEESVRMLETTLAMPCFAEPSLRERIYAYASSVVHTPIESSGIRLAAYSLVGLIAAGLFFWLDHSSETWVVQASVRTRFWLEVCGLISAAILTAIFLFQRYAPGAGLAGAKTGTNSRR
jgi:hypothetical protein